jgi:26S proteasome regulatory subunit T1
VLVLLLTEQTVHSSEVSVLSKIWICANSPVIGSELVQKYIGEGARMIRELFEMARTKKACIIFFDEIDAIGGARFDDGAGGDNEVQRTMLELIVQLDGFDARGNIKVIMATNR